MTTIEIILNILIITGGVFIIFKAKRIALSIYQLQVARYEIAYSSKVTIFVTIFPK